MLYVWGLWLQAPRVQASMTCRHRRHRVCQLCVPAHASHSQSIQCAHMTVHVICNNTIDSYMPYSLSIRHGHVPSGMLQQMLERLALIGSSSSSWLLCDTSAMYVPHMCCVPWVQCSCSIQCSFSWSTCMAYVCVLDSMRAEFEDHPQSLPALACGSGWSVLQRRPKWMEVGSLDGGQRQQGRSIGGSFLKLSFGCLAVRTLTSRRGTPSM